MGSEYPDQSPGQALTSLLSWFEDVGVQLNAEILRLELMHAGPAGSSARCVRATKDINEGDQLGVIPKAALLSIRTTSVADIIRSERLAGGLGLIFAAMHERSLGPDSHW